MNIFKILQKVLPLSSQHIFVSKSFRVILKKSKKESGELFGTLHTFYGSVHRDLVFLLTSIVQETRLVDFSDNDFLNFPYIYIFIPWYSC